MNVTPEMKSILEKFSISTTSIPAALKDVNSLTDDTANLALAELGFTPEEDAEATTMLTHVATGILKTVADLNVYVETKMASFREAGPQRQKTTTRPKPGLALFAEPTPAVETVQEVAEPAADASTETVAELPQAEPESVPETTSTEQTCVEPAPVPAANDAAEPAAAVAPKEKGKRGRKKSGNTAYDRAALAMTALVSGAAEGQVLAVKDAVAAIMAADGSIPETSARVYASLYNKNNGAPFEQQRGARGERAPKTLSRTGYDRAVVVITATLAEVPTATRKDLILAVMELASIKESSAAVYVSVYFTKTAKAAEAATAAANDADPVEASAEESAAA